MDKEKKLMTYLVVLMLLTMWVSLMWNKSNSDLNEKKIEIKELSKRVDDLQKSNDSIAMEILPIQIELGRYQVAYEIFKERNPKAASQYDDIISKETE